MKPGDLIAIGIIVVIIGLASFYIYRAKKSGKRCIGCPYSDSCGGNCCSPHIAETDESQPPVEEQKPETAQPSGCTGNCAGCTRCGENKK